MFTKVKKSLGKINYKLFLALLVMGLCPTVYTTLRVFFLGEMPGEWSFSIAGQLSWVNLLYEILSEAIVLPLHQLWWTHCNLWRLLSLYQQTSQGFYL